MDTGIDFIRIGGELSVLLRDFFILYGSEAIFLSVLFFGEAAILTAFILSGQGLFPPGQVIILSSVASLVADIFWFIVGRYFPLQVVPGAFRRTMFGPIAEFLGSITKDRIFLSILFLKFFIGTRLAVIIYLSRQQLSSVRFIVYDSIGIVSYLMVLAAIGLSVGKWIYIVVPAYRTVVTILTIAIIIYFCVFISRRLIRSKITTVK